MNDIDKALHFFRNACMKGTKKPTKIKPTTKSEKSQKLQVKNQTKTKKKKKKKKAPKNQINSHKKLVQNASALEKLAAAHQRVLDAHSQGIWVASMIPTAVCIVVMLVGWLIGW